jgi:hypothetical protein
MNQTPLLLVNVDGVLTSARTYLLGDSKHHRHLDPVAVGLLATIAQAAGARVVMATAWVAMYPTAAEWVELFKGVGYDINIVDVISDEEWMRSDRLEAIRKRIDTENYVLLIDDIVETPDLHAVQVNSRAGLGIEEVVSALKFLAPHSPLLSETESMMSQFG